MALLAVSHGRPCDEAALFLVFVFSLNIVDLFILVYLVSLSVINGAKSWNDVKKALITGFLPVMKVCVDLPCSLVYAITYSCRFPSQVMWLISPPSILYAQYFLSPEVGDYVFSPPMT